ncbi:MAG: peptide/nickel transport system substrate-binding protein [Cellvibrionaceae bacterium]|jgi:peptide/nickel transport system substrate-binding protein
MKFRIFLGFVCLVFVSMLLLYGTDLRKPDQVEIDETNQVNKLTPEFDLEVSEPLSCKNVASVLANGPLVMGLVGRPVTLLPFNPASSGTRNPIETELAKLIFRGLVRFNSAGEPLPDLASWQVAEDGLSVIFTFDQGAMWHDGTPLTAADVAFTVSTLASGDYTTPGDFPWDSVGVQIIDSTNVQLSLPIPFAPLLEAATVGLLPSHLGINAQNLQGSDFASQPIGNGDFRVVNRWDRDGLILLEPIAPALLDSLEIRFYPTLADMASDFEIEELDLAVFPPYSTILALDGIPTEQYNLFSSPTGQITQLFFRIDGVGGIESGAGSPIMTSGAVRQALRLSLDRRTLIDSAANGQGIVTEGPWSLENQFHDKRLFPIVQTDLALAAALLDEAGWLLPEDALSQTIRQKEGVNLELEILVSNQGITSQIADELALQWSDIGVRAIVTALPPADYQTAITGRDFDLTVQKTRLSNDPDLYDFWSQEAIVRGQNISRWNNRPASEALEAGRQVWDYELRKPYYNAFRTFFEKELPAFSLFQDSRSIAVNSRVAGPIVGYPGELTEFVSRFSEWYVIDENVDANCSDAS